MPAKAVRAVALLALIWPAAASAEVKLTLRDGRVSLVARDATVRQILVEWARVGQTRIVNVDRIPGGPLTLELNDVPEAEALDLLLKSVTGYMAAPRPVGAGTLSRYDRILVLPTAAVARVPVTGTPPPVFQPPNIQQMNPEEDEAPSFPPRGPLFPTLQQPQPDVSFPQVIEDQVNFPAQMPPPSEPQQPATAAPFPGAVVGTPRPGMVMPTPQPQGQPGPGQGFIITQQPPPQPDN
jgi:hypothetical protein